MRAKYITWVALAGVLAACDSPLNVDPTSAIDAEKALNSPRALELAINGAYRALQTSDLYGRTMTVYPELYADNLDFTGTFQTDREVSARNISPSNGAVLLTWRDAYAGINRVNNVLAAVPAVSGVGAAEGRQLRGEALFIRALNYFNLVRYFGGVPITTEPSKAVTEQSNLPRSSAQEVYALITKDLEEAATLLPAGKSPARATQGAANALLARVYLEMGQYAKARDKATAVIQGGKYQLTSDFRDVFAVENGPESIFELQYSTNNANSQAFFYFPQALGGRYGYAPSAGLFNAFEAGDRRKAASVGLSGTRRYGTKFFRIGNGDDNVIVLRLAEMYLIRAEANARLGAVPATVVADLNVVRARAGLPALDAAKLTATEALIGAILHERRVELAMEGHRFFDLRRTGRAQQVLGLAPTRLLFPIPQAERDVNRNLEQNPGY